MPTQAIVADNAPQRARLGESHGYHFDRDMVRLNADLALPEAQTSPRELALQLWACEQPHMGGALRGLKVAEAALTVGHATPGAPVHVELETAAHLPAGDRDHSMVLVLAEGEQGRFDRPCDFANYARTERFFGPVLQGAAGYRIDGDRAEPQVALQAERIFNTRAADNLSGSLVLELLAIPDAPASGPSHVLATAQLGTLGGQTGLHHVAQSVPFQPPPAGTFRIALQLREWAGNAGFVTRDAVHFSAPYTQAPEVPLATVTPLKLVRGVEERPAPTKVAASSEQALRPQVGATDACKADAPPATTAPEAASPRAMPRPVAKPTARTTAPTPAKARTLSSATSSVASAAKHQPAKAQPVAAVAKVSLSRASVDELAAVDGLNRKLAIAIVKARPFRSLDDLTKIKGVGTRTVTKLRASLEL